VLFAEGETIDLNGLRRTVPVYLVDAGQIVSDGAGGVRAPMEVYPVLETVVPDGVGGYVAPLPIRLVPSSALVPDGIGGWRAPVPIAISPGFDFLSLFDAGDGGDVWLAAQIDAPLGSPVASWVGARGTAAAQAIAGRQPTLRGSGSKRWLEFAIDDMDGEDVLGDGLLAEFEISTAALTIIVAAHNEDTRETGSTADDNDFNCRTVCLKVPQAGGSERDLNIHHNRPKFADPETTTNYGAAGVRHPQNQAVNLTAAANAALATAGVVTYQRNGTAIQDAWVDGEAVARNTTTTTTFTSTHLGIGYGLTTSLDFNTTGVGHLIGKIAGILIIDRVLSVARRLAAEAAFKALRDAMAAA
jgi:hypothetical protein